MADQVKVPGGTVTDPNSETGRLQFMQTAAELVTEYKLAAEFFGEVAQRLYELLEQMGQQRRPELWRVSQIAENCERVFGVLPELTFSTSWFLSALGCTVCKGTLNASQPPGTFPGESDEQSEGREEQPPEEHRGSGDSGAGSAGEGTEAR